MKILITGICGFVGSVLARSMRSAYPDWEILGIDNLSRSGSWMNKEDLERHGIRLFVGDIRSTTDVESLPDVDWVVDAAANASVLAGVDGKASSRQLVEHNLLGTVNLLEFCKRAKAGFILLSTSRVYSIPPMASMEVTVESRSGNPCRERYSPVPDQLFPEGLSTEGIAETFSTRPPVSLYGSTKVASEHLALEYGQVFGFPVWINRCGVMAGAGQFGHPAQGIFAFWIHSYRENRPLKYIGFDGKGRQVRDCLHPRDLLPLLEKQFKDTGSQTDHPRTVNVSGGLEGSMSLAELTAWCRDRFPGSDRSEPASSPEKRPFDLPWLVLDHALAARTWDWQPVTPLSGILEEIAAHAEAHPDWMNGVG